MCDAKRLANVRPPSLAPQPDADVPGGQPLSASLRLGRRGFVHTVAAGAAVTEGQQLVCVEAMKMEMWLCAQAGGTVKAVFASTGDQVESGALLVELDINQPKDA